MLCSKGWGRKAIILKMSSNLPQPSIRNSPYQGLRSVPRVSTGDGRRSWRDSGTSNKGSPVFAPKLSSGSLQNLCRLSCILLEKAGKILRLLVRDAHFFPNLLFRQRLNQGLRSVPRDVTWDGWKGSVRLDVLKNEIDDSHRKGRGRDRVI